MKVRPPFGASDRNVPVDLSRKRKADILDKKSNNSTPIFDGMPAPVRGSQSENSAYLLARVSDSQYDSRTFSGRNVRGSTPGVISNQNLHFAVSCNGRSQFGKGQFYDMSNNNSLDLEARDGNNQRAAVENTNINCRNSQHISFIHNIPSPSPLLNSSLLEFPVQPFSPSRSHDMISQSDGNKLQSHSSGQIASIEKDHTFFNLKGGMTLEQRSHSLCGNSLPKLFSSHSDSLESLEVLQHSMVDQDFGHYGIKDGRTHFQDFSKFGSSSDFKQNGQNFDVVGTRDISNAGIASSQTSAFSVQHKVSKSCHAQDPRVEVRGRYSWDTVLSFNVNSKAEDQACSVTSQMSMAENSSRENICLEDSEVNREDQGSTNTVINVSKIPCESSLDIANQRLVNKNLPDATDSAIKKLEHGDDSSFSPKFDGKGALNNEKVASKVIWDGLLQLNASTTVSTLAFFKSGEKSLEVNWSKHIEVKGKVKLEAFEKYIQELPRSRSRALMVLSLCWKVGSSKSGLTGMKEVAKGYCKGDKVGFAQPAPGIDLYVCPHNDTIITILARHGFFKGMAAVEGNKDSLIGCVVWRKNRTSSTSVSKSSEKMKLLMSEQQLDFPSESTLLRAVEMSSPLATTPPQGENCAMPSTIQPSEISSPLVSVSETRSSSLVSESMSTKIKDTQDSNDLVKVDNYHVTDVSPEIITLVSDNSPVISTAPPTVKELDSFLHQPMEGLLKSDVLNINVSEPKKLDAGLKLLETVLTASQILGAPQRRSISPEEDDLPEFDFSTACGFSQCPESKLQSLNTKSCFSDSSQPCKQNTIEGLRNSVRPIPPALPMMRPMATVSSQQRLCETSLRGLRTDECQGVPLPGKQGESDSQAPMLLIAEEKLVTLGGQMSSKPATVKPENLVTAVQGANSHIPQKNLWDDDDDMPEWCPPDLEHKNQLPATEATGLSNISHVLESASENGPPPPLLAPNSMSVNPLLQPGFPPGSNLGSLSQRPGTTVMMPQQTRPIPGFAHLSPSGFNPRPLRPQHPPFDSKLSFMPVDWRARKP